ncbi:MAG: hypothetical protein JXR26_05070 [Balneolaceae bacterium]|nr:hypothetical protein [Balneolaceae bacterium]
MRLLSPKNLLLILSLCVLGVACNDSSTGGMEDPNKATFNGKVENTSSQQSEANKDADNISAVEGAVVTAAHVTADGELQTIGDAQAETNAEGEYTLQVDVSAAADAASRIVIVAESEGETAKAFVTGNVQNGSSFTVQPISFESSAEAEVFQNLVANGNAGVVTKADIEITVKNDIAADIQSNAQNATDIAAALVSSAEAKARFYAEKGVEISQEQRDQIVQIKQEAQVQLATALHAATSTEEQQAAFEAFLQAVANAQLEAGVEAWAVAEAADFGARVLVKNSSSLSADAQSEVRKQAYYLASIAVDAAVRTEAEVLEASDSTIDALADAGATLQAEIRSTTNASKEQIDSFFVQFNEDVQAALNSDSSVNGSAFVNANTAISGSAGLKTTLESTLDATADLNTMLSAYSAFSTGVEGIVDTNFTDAGEAEAQAYTRLLILINLAS